MDDKYDLGYKQGRRDESFEWKLRILQAGLTAVVFAGLSFLSNNDRKRDIVNDFEKYSTSSVAKIFYDENEPHKYNPNPSSSSRE